MELKPAKYVKLIKYSNLSMKDIFRDGLGYCAVCYLIVLEGDWKDKIQVNPSPEFFKYAEKIVLEYVKKGILPDDKQVAGAVLNLADDILSGRAPVMRAGDYIAIQNQMHSG